MDSIIYEVLDRIEKQGFEAYLVGGYVRDLILKTKSFDVDITTNARPKDLINIFKDYDVKSLEYGNISFDIAPFSFEITTYRKDIIYIDKRKPKIEYVSSLEEDLKRRDFTVNTICMNKDGKIIDYLNALTDIKKKILRAVGDPLIRLEEDSLRILRAIRFATVLNFKVEDNLYNAIKIKKDNLQLLSYNRRKEELNKIFRHPNKSRGIKLIKDLGLLNVLDLHDIDNALRTNHTIGIWAAVGGDSYPFTKNEKDIILEVRALLNEDINDLMVLYRHDSLAINIVCDLKKINKKKIIKKFDSLPIKERKEIKITSDEICEILNKEAGPFLKNIFCDLEKDIIYGNVINDKGILKAYIKEKYGTI